MEPCHFKPGDTIVLRSECKDKYRNQQKSYWKSESAMITEVYVSENTNTWWCRIKSSISGYRNSYPQGDLALLKQLSNKNLVNKNLVHLLSQEW